MAAYIARRLLALAPVLLIVATVGFFLIYLTPGDPAAVMLGPDATDEDLATLRQIMGLDRPLLVQLGRWYARVLRGDLGYSIFLQRPVLQAIYERLEPTGLLTVLSLLLAIAIGVPAGIAAAVRRNTWVDQASMGVALVGVSVPNFWLGLNLILLFSVYLGLFPVAGYVPLAESAVGTLRTLVLPAVTLGISASALIARMTRSSMLEVLGQDYVRTARAKGNRERRVVYWHALRNAMIPTVTVIGLALGGLLAGAVVTETVFALPGVGRLVISSVLRRDYPVVQGVLMFIAAIYVLVNLLIDVIYVYLDPRVKYA
ncbi:MAG: ABC transporter permease [Armatimonadota bacterium]|nr:ABC transporter permease [Armatimonadota bacterium]MDR7454777.1 ABC transporter permease [Armatimonadota bacterium]MDR7497778.1 ABC transporter permease [Armatimonadota bacterium]